MDGVAYVNNSFYTSYSGLTITSVNNTTFKFTLPQIPVALGKNEGLATLNFSNNNTKHIQIFRKKLSLMFVS